MCMPYTRTAIDMRHAIFKLPTRKCPFFQIIHGLWHKNEECQIENISDSSHLFLTQMNIPSATTVCIWKHLTLMGILVSYGSLKAYAHCSTKFHCNDSIYVVKYLATTNEMRQLFASISFHIIRILFFLKRMWI